MSLDQLFKHVKNVFQGRGQEPNVAQLPFIDQSEQKEVKSAPDPDAVAAIAAALHLSGSSESKSVLDSDIAAAIATALHLQLSGAGATYGSDKKSYALSSWSQYGRVRIQNTRFQIFNRPVSSEKSILIRQR